MKNVEAAQDIILRESLSLAQLSQSEKLSSSIFSFLLIETKAASRPMNISNLKIIADWMLQSGLKFEDLRARHIATFIESYPASTSRKRGLLSFLKTFLGFLEVDGVLDRNPASSVRHLKNPYRNGGVTPAISSQDLQRLMSDEKRHCDPIWIRDKALIAVLTNTFARVGAVCNARCSDIIQIGGISYLKLVEKDSKIEMQEIRSDLMDLLFAYLKRYPPASELSYIFRSASGPGGKIKDKPLGTRGAYNVLKKRGEEVGLKGIRPHVQRVTGMNEFRNRGGTREEARKRMGHSSEKMVLYYERDTVLEHD